MYDRVKVAIVIGDEEVGIVGVLGSAGIFVIDFVSKGEPEGVC